MIELLEKMLKLDEGIYSTLHVVGGWILPSGEIIDIGSDDHVVDAVRRMKKIIGGDYPKGVSGHQSYLDLMRLRKYIRIIEDYPEELDVSVGGKVSSAQLFTIGKLVRNFNDFYYDIINQETGKKDQGRGYHEFVETLKTCDLLESIKESSIDFPREALDLSVWDKKNETYAIKPKVKDKILEIIKRYPEIAMGYDLMNIVARGGDGQPTIYIMGSICTNQYVNDSDIDIHLQVSKKSPLYDDKEFQKSVSKWFFDRKNIEKIDSFVGKHPVELYIQYRFVRPQIDSCYDLMRDIWLVEPKIVSLDFDPYDEYSDILEDIRSIVSNVDELLGELKRDVIDYEVMQEALKNLPKEYREPLLKKLKLKLQEIEDDILNLGSERHQWSVARDKASELLSKGAKSTKKELENWEEANAIFKFAVRYRYVKVIKELENLMEDDEITPDEISKVKSILGI